MPETNADQSPAASTREPGPADERGWYWVNRFGQWEPMQTDGNWVLMSTSRTLTRITPSFEIGPRIPSPAERAGDAALGERLQTFEDSLKDRWSRRVAAIRRSIDKGAYGENGKVVMEAVITTIGECSADLEIDVRAALVALTPSAPGSGTGWRDISTAPRDGTPVDLWADARKTDCSWSKALGYWCRQGGHDQGYSYVVRVDNPTHWQPLPSPPGAAEEDGL